MSIITPTLNQAAYIRDAIDSIRAQRYPNVEHIVIDGGSTDGTLEILREQESTYRVRWISEPDRGMYQAINKGLALAEGEILAYLNSDDAYPRWAVEAAVAAFEADPAADVIYGDGLQIDQRKDRQSLFVIPPFDPNSLALYGSLVQPAVFFRRRVYESIGGFDDRLSFVGDLEYWLRAGRALRFRRIDEVLAVERVHDGAMSFKYARQMLREDAEARVWHTRPSIVPLRIRRLRARVRGLLWRRYLWLQFLGARRSGASRRRWVRFLSEGDVVVSPIRFAAMFVPKIGGRFSWNAVSSRHRWLTRPKAPTS